MKRIFASILLALYTACALAQVPIYTRPQGAAVGLTNAASVAITGGTISGVTLSGTNAKTNLLSTAIPFLAAPTGTMANNGAVTFGTALDTTYADGMWVLYPAGAVAAGVPAAPALLWTVMSSTTVGTVFNSTYTAGQPALGTTTAFATTGPGAFTGVTLDTTIIDFILPANTLGPNGYIEAIIHMDANSTVGAKQGTVKFGGSSFSTLSVTSAASAQYYQKIANRGLTNRQVGNVAVAAQGGWGTAGASNQVKTSIDTTLATNHFIVSMSRTTATDWLMIAALELNAVFRP